MNLKYKYICIIYISVPVTLEKIVAFVYTSMCYNIILFQKNSICIYYNQICVCEEKIKWFLF